MSQLFVVQRRKNQIKVHWSHNYKFSLSHSTNRFKEHNESNNGNQLQTEPFKKPDKHLSCLKFTSLNCRSLRGKTANLKVLLEDNKIDVVILQETWLNKGDSSIYEEFSEMGFKIMKLERVNKRGGGLAIFVKQEIISINKISAEYKYKFTEFETFVCNFKMGRTNLTIVNLYRKPSGSKSSFLREFETFLIKVLEQNGQLIITGDFNIDLKENDGAAVDFINLLRKYDLIQLIYEPTRGPSLLDLVITQSYFSNQTHLEINNQANFPSDHRPLFFNISHEPSVLIRSKSIFREVRNFNLMDHNDFRQEISNSPLTDAELLSNMNSLECVNLYNKTIETIVNKLCPKQMRRFCRDQSKQWYNGSLNKLKREKRQAERALKKSPNSTSHLQAYKKIKNNYTSKLKEARAKYFSAEIRKSKDDPKSLYKILNRLTGKTKEKVLPTSDPEEVTAENLSEFYLEKVEKIRKSITLDTSNSKNSSPRSRSTTHKNQHCNRFESFEEIDSNNLKKTISSLKKKFSTLDPVPTTILMSCIDELLPIILKIINSAIQECEFPNPLKHAIITPILKKALLDPELYNNYRPVSSLTFLSKIIEKILYIQLVNYIENNNLYPTYQSSYRQNHSCETALTKLIDDIQTSVINGKNVALVLLDCSAAFDTIDHDILFAKLEDEYGITKKALQLIKSYFQNRSFSTIIKSTKSEPRHLQYGVPQGSLLGPLFYILYTKEIEAIVLKHNLGIMSYADDIQIYAIFDDNEEGMARRKIKICINEIKCWMKDNFLKLNDEKTVIKLFNHKKSKISDFDVIGETTKGVIKILGADLNHPWQFNDFIKRKIQTCNYHLRNLYNIRLSLDTQTRILLVTNLILSNIDYCNILLLGAPDTELRPLHLMINKSLRFIYHVNFKDHISPLYKKAHFLPIKKRIQFKACLIAYKIFHYQTPTFFLDDITKFVSTSNMTLREVSGSRDDHTFSIDGKRNKEKRLTTLIIREWNSLPLQLRRVAEISLFKSKLKTLLFDM